MAVRIRLSRGGCKKRPFYRIVVADARAPRDGRFIERIGSYNPMLPQGHADRLVIDEAKVKEWIAKGATPTDRLDRMFADLGLVAKTAMVAQPIKSAPKAKAMERLKEKEAKAKAAAEAAASSAE